MKTKKTDCSSRLHVAVVEEVTTLIFQQAKPMFSSLSSLLTDELVLVRPSSGLFYALLRLDVDSILLYKTIDGPPRDFMYVHEAIAT